MTAAAQSPLRRAHGTLSLRFVARDGATRVEILERRPPLAVVRSFRTPGGAALVHMHNVSGGVLGGDTLDTTIEVGPAARAQVTTVGATQAYRSADGLESRQTSTVRVGAGALLEYLPDPLIPFAGALASQRTAVELDEDAGLFWWEIVASGRVARGERFEYERVRIASEIRALGRLVALERFTLEPSAASPASAARLAGADYFGSFFVCRAGIERARWSALEADIDALAAQIEAHGDARVGCSTLPAHGVVVRALAPSRRAIAAAFDRVWRVAKRELYDEDVDPPRKAH